MHIHLSSDTPIDLQMHTTYSDGRWSAEHLFDYLAEEGFGLVAVTDHDRVDTVASIQHLGARKHVPALAAVEISAEFRGKMGDVLCFGFDPHDQALRAIADDVRQRQKDNAEEVYEELLRRGYQFPHRKAHLAETAGELRVAGDCGILLIKHGYVNDWPSALELVTDAGYREMKADMAQTVEAVHRSGGVALIAHPGRGLREPQEFTYYTPDLLDQVRASIPLDGIEVYYPTHSPELVETYLAYARASDLLVSAGSDSHDCKNAMSLVIMVPDLLVSAGSDSHGPPGRMPIKYRAELCRRLLERVGVEVQ